MKEKLEKLISSWEKEADDLSLRAIRCHVDDYMPQYSAKSIQLRDCIEDIKLLIASSDRVRKGNITCESCGKCNSKVQSPAICTSDIYCSMQGDIIGEQGD